MTNIALPDVTWAIPSGRALMLRTQSLRLFAVPVSIAIALSGCSGSIMVWTAGDIFGLAILGIVAVVFLLMMLAALVQVGVRKVRRLFVGERGAK